MSDEDQLQRFVDLLYRTRTRATRLDAVVLADSLDLDEDLLEIVGLLPPGTYSRQRLCDQINSALRGHCWTDRYRTVE